MGVLFLVLCYLLFARSCPSVRLRRLSVCPSSLLPIPCLTYSRFSLLFSLLVRTSSVLLFRLPSFVIRLHFPLLSLSLSRLYIVARTHARTYIHTHMHTSTRTYVRTRARGLFFAHTLAAPQAGEARSRDAPHLAELRYCYVTLLRRTPPLPRPHPHLRPRLSSPFRSRGAREVHVHTYIHTYAVLDLARAHCACVV